MRSLPIIPWALLFIAILFTPGGNLSAQSTDDPQDEAKGFTFYEQFQGSSNTLGQVMKFDTSVGYNINRFFGVDAGLPFYIVRASSTSTSTTSGTGTSSNNGIGNAYVDLRLTVDNPLVNFASTLTGMAPTGDTNKGFSTGRATFDWTNHFDRRFGSIRPFANLGVGNTISDTHFFSRPFTTLGLVSHFEGGASYGLWHLLRVGASLYDILPSGQQKVFSKLIARQMSATTVGMSKRHGAGVFENASETVGGADIARDNGFSVWFDVGPVRYLNLELGFNRSVHYDLNTVSFGVGVNLGSLVRIARGF